MKQLAGTGCVIDFATMPQYSAVNALIEMQPYIRRAFSIEGWIQENDGCGAQPRIPPRVPPGYDDVVHLTYEHRPKEPLVFHAYRVLGISWPVQPVLPFLEVEARPDPTLITYGFNPSYLDRKFQFFRAVTKALPDMQFVDVTAIPFVQAAQRIKASRFFLGCRSANYVVAHGVGQRILTYEPNPGRRDAIFSCPYGHETLHPPDQVGQFVATARAWAYGGRDADH